MEFYRSNLYQALVKAIEEQEKLEKSWGYTGDSGYLWSIRNLAEKVRSGEVSTIHLEG